MAPPTTAPAKPAPTVYPALPPAAIAPHLTRKLPNTVAKPLAPSSIQRTAALTTPTPTTTPRTAIPRTPAPPKPVVTVRPLTPNIKTTTRIAQHPAAALRRPVTQQRSAIQQHHLVRAPTKPVARAPGTVVRTVIPAAAKAPVIAPGQLRAVSAPAPQQLAVRRTIVKPRQLALVDEMRALIRTPIWEYALPATDAKLSAEQLSMLFDDEFSAAVNTINGEIGSAAAKTRVASCVK